MERASSSRLRRGAVLAGVLGLLVPLRQAAAQDPLPLEFHGFVSQGYVRSTANNFLVESEDGTFEFSEVGLNVTAPLSDSLSAGMQLFARDLGRIGDYKPVFDWYYLNYRWKDHLGFRVGRIKLPFGLYNDTSDIDAARTPVLLPQSVYPAQNRDFLLAATGGEVFGFADLGGAGSLDYRLYGGTIFLDIEPSPTSTFDVLRLTAPYVVGGRVMWEAPSDQLRVGGSLQALRLDADLRLKKDPTQSASIQLPAVLWVGSLEYTPESFLFALEYSRWYSHVDSTNPKVLPETRSASERAYAMGSWRVNPWLQPGVYYSILYPDVDKRQGRAQQQHDVALTLRFDPDPHWLIKLEGHYMHGTGGLTRGLNDNRALSELDEDWGLFLIKTTAYF